jgi:hypothetical protein
VFEQVVPGFGVEVGDGGWMFDAEIGGHDR